MLRIRRIAALAAPAMAALVAVLLMTASASATARQSQRPHAASGSQPNSAVELGTAKISGLGTVLVRGDGHAVYMFMPQAGTRTACSGSCQRVWSLLIAPSGGTAKAIGGARQSLIGSVEDPKLGKRIVTYDNWPLYTYVLDKRADQANGQNILMGGGKWWVLTAKGKPIRTPVSRGIEVGS